MSSRQTSMFASERAQMTDSIRRTVDLLNEYGPRFRRWRVAWSGGKDSTAVVTLLVYLIESGQVQAPADGLEVLYADTRMELPPLWLAAQDIRWDLEERGYPVKVVMAPLEKRFLPYILGRVGRPRKGAKPRRKHSIQAQDSTWTAWEREAARRSRPGAAVSIADIFEEVGESFPEAVTV